MHPRISSRFVPRCRLDPTRTRAEKDYYFSIAMIARWWLTPWWGHSQPQKPSLASRALAPWLRHTPRILPRRTGGVPMFLDEPREGDTFLFREVSSTKHLVLLPNDDVVGVGNTRRCGSGVGGLGDATHTRLTA